MKTILITFSLLLGMVSSYGQNPFSLKKSVSFGLNNHTNRDYPNFSIVDNEKNTILIGTTERDSTFNDIIITKLDENYNLIWQKKSSIATSLSYEIPLKVVKNTNDDIYVFGASKTNSTQINGKLFYIKYDKKGNELIKKIIELEDEINYHDIGYLDIKLNIDDSVKLVFSPHTYNGFGSNKFYFFIIEPNGNDTLLFTKEISNQGIKGKILNDSFYFIFRRLKNSNNTDEGYLHTFLKIDKEGNENLLSIENPDFHNYNFNNNYENFILNVDNQKNLYTITQNQSDNDTKGRINISVINNENVLKFVLTTSVNKNYYFINSFINSKNQLVIIANDLDAEKLVFLSVDNNNQIITLKEIDTYLGTGFKLNNDDSFFITSSNSNIRLFSNDLNEINSFNNSNTYNLIDFSKIDDNTITSLGVEVNKMYPESDINSDLNIISEKINTTNVLFKYSFSGEGTSNVFQHKTYVDNDNNYIILATEKLGPLCKFIGCAQPPLSVRIIKYNSDLEKIWEFDLVGQVSNIDSYYEGNNLKIDSNNNVYLNLLNKERDKSHLYKISSKGTLLYKKESVKSKEVIIHENTNKVYVISDNIQYIDQNTFKTSVWSEVLSFELNTGNLINKVKYDHKQYFNHYLKDNDFYLYFQNISTADNYSSNKIISLYKENEKLFEQILNLKNDSELNEFSPVIMNDGSIVFSSYYSNDINERKLHKITLDNKYYYSNINERLYQILKINNKIIGFDDEQYLNIYDDKLNLLKKSNTTFSNCCSGFNISILDNKIFIQWSNPNEINSAFLNEDLEIINDFNFTNLFYKNFIFDKESNLITTSTYGNGIYLKPWVSWRRGLLSKYNFDSTLSIDDYNTSYKDDIIKLFPNPTRDLFTIILKKNIFKKVNIYSINGQLLNTFFSNKIDLSTYINGLYLLKIYTLENTVINSKILKK